MVFPLVGFGLSEADIADDITGLSGDLGGLGAGVSRDLNGRGQSILGDAHKVGVTSGGVIGVECDHGFSFWV